MTFLVVGLVIGAAAGVGVGYVMFGGDDDTEYWFFLDFNGEDTDVDDQWISAKGKDLVSAMKKALDAKNIEYDIEDSGWVNELGGISGKTGFDWMNWGWTDSSNNSILWAWQATSGLDTTIMNWIYIGYTEVDSMWTPSLDPNSTTAKWGTTGPFAE